MNEEVKGKKSPQLRFSGFDDEWEEKKLENFCTESRIVGHTGNEARKLTVKLWGKGVVEKNEVGSESTQYFYRKAGQFVYSQLDFLNSAFAVIPKEFDGYETTQDLPAFDLKNLNPYFLFYRVIQESFFLKNGNMANGSRKAKRIHAEDFLEMKMITPTLAEQDMISNFFSRYDSLIQAKTKKLESLKAVKKSLLQKCFPKAGEKVPEIRFAGFSGDWEESQLSELLEVSNLHNRDDKFRKEDIYSVSREFGVINQIEYQGKSLAGASLVNYKVVKRGNVVYTKSPLAEQPYGIIKANKNKDGIVSTLYGVYKEKDNCDSNFIQIYFDDNNRLNDYLRPLINKGAKNTILVSDEDALSGLIKYPSKPEQQKIGQFFSKYDSLISAQQKEIDKLKDIKKSLLQKMFV